MSDKEFLDPLDALLEDVEISPPGPNGAVFSPQNILSPEPIPEANEDNLVCLRGPCKHYMQVDQLLETLNPKGSLASIPVMINRYCRLQNLDLTDSCVFNCTEWDPKDPIQLVELKNRREQYMASRGGNNE